MLFRSRTKSFRVVFKDAESKKKIVTFRDSKGVVYYTLTRKGLKQVISNLVELNAIMNNDYYREEISGTSAMPALHYITSSTLSQSSSLNPNVIELLDRIKRISRHLDI